MVRIGTCVDFGNIEQVEAKFATLKENNFDNCQLMCWNHSLMTQENADIIKGLCEKYGVTISALWCGWEGPCVWNFYEGPTTLGLVPPEYRLARIKNMWAGSDFAEMLGVSDIITHMGFIPENPSDPNFQGFCDAVYAVAKYMKKKNQYLLFETGQETPVALVRTFEKVMGMISGTDVQVDNLGINLDTANCILYGKANPVDALDVFGKYVRNLHAKDGKFPVNGHDLGEETPIGEGKVDFDALIRELHNLGYDRYITIEREISGDQQLVDILKARELLEGYIAKYYN